jgi:hypothetical protein
MLSVTRMLRDLADAEHGLTNADDGQAYGQA